MNVPLFNALAPEFSTLDAAGVTQRDLLATQAETEIDETTFGTKYDAAVALITAHYLKLAAGAGMLGIVQTDKVGDLSRTYKVMFGDVSDWDSTSYGQAFKRLRKQIVRTPILVMT